MVQFNLTYQTGTSIEQIVGFELAAEIWSYYLADDITVELHVGMSNTLPPGIIGGAVSNFVQADFAAVQAALAQDATSENDNLAVSTLNLNVSPEGIVQYTALEGNTLKQGSDLIMTQANAEALGLVETDNLDGFIVVNSLNNSPYTWNYDYSGTSGNTSENSLSFLSVALHEIGHILGFASSIDINAIGHDVPAALMDLYRHSADSTNRGAIELTPEKYAYFSIDGGQTNVVGMSSGLEFDANGNYVRGYQASHWEVIDPVNPYEPLLGTLLRAPFDILGAGNGFLANLLQPVQPLVDVVQAIYTLTTTVVLSPFITSYDSFVASNGPYHGVMSPTLGSDSNSISEVDLLAFDVLGYDLATKAPFDYAVLLNNVLGRLTNKLSAESLDKALTQLVEENSDVLERRRSSVSASRAGFWQEIDPSLLTTDRMPDGWGAADFELRIDTLEHGALSPASTNNSVILALSNDIPTSSQEMSDAPKSDLAGLDLLTPSPADQYQSRYITPPVDQLTGLTPDAELFIPDPQLISSGHKESSAQTNKISANGPWDEQRNYWQDKLDHWQGKLSGWDTRLNDWNGKHDRWDDRLDRWNDRLEGWEQRLNGWEQQLNGWEQQPNNGKARLDRWGQQLDRWEQQLGGWEQQLDRWEQRLGSSIVNASRPLSSSESVITNQDSTFIQSRSDDNQIPPLTIETPLTSGMSEVHNSSNTVFDTVLSPINDLVTGSLGLNSFDRLLGGLFNLF